MNSIERDSVIYCENFKIALLFDDKISPDPIIPAYKSTGFTVSLSVVFAKVLEVCKLTALQHLQKTYKSDVTVADIVWVLTVPNIYRYNS